jgi:hypothetical protein
VPACAFPGRSLSARLPPQIDSYREHLFVTTYVYDLVDRPRKGKDEPKETPQKAPAGRAPRGSGGGPKAGDVEAPAAGAGNGGAGGGCCKGGPCWPWRRKRHRTRHVAWADESVGRGIPGWRGGDGGRLGRPVGRGDESTTSSSASSSGFGSDTSSDGVGGGEGACGAGPGGERRLLRSYGRAWRDDDEVQALLEGWQHKLHQDRAALVRDWQAAADTPAGRAQQGGGGGNARPGGGMGHAAGAGGREGEARAARRPGLSAHEASSHARSAARTAVQLPRGAGAHLGAKHRRRVRLRSPLQAPFYAYSVGRVAGVGARSPAAAGVRVCGRRTRPPAAPSLVSTGHIRCWAPGLPIDRLPRHPPRLLGACARPIHPLRLPHPLRRHPRQTSGRSLGRKKVMLEQVGTRGCRPSRARSTSPVRCVGRPAARSRASPPPLPRCRGRSIEAKVVRARPRHRGSLPRPPQRARAALPTRGSLAANPAANPQRCPSSCAPAAWSSRCSRRPAARCRRRSSRACGACSRCWWTARTAGCCCRCAGVEGMGVGVVEPSGCV